MGIERRDTRERGHADGFVDGTSRSCLRGSGRTVKVLAVEA